MEAEEFHMARIGTHSKVRYRLSSRLHILGHAFQLSSALFFKVLDLFFSREEEKMMDECSWSAPSFSRGSNPFLIEHR